MKESVSAYMKFYSIYHYTHLLLNLSSVLDIVQFKICILALTLLSFVPHTDQLSKFQG